MFDQFNDPNARKNQKSLSEYNYFDLKAIIFRA